MTRNLFPSLKHKIICYVGRWGHTHTFTYEWKCQHCHLQKNSSSSSVSIKVYKIVLARGVNENQNYVIETVRFRSCKSYLRWARALPGSKELQTQLPFQKAVPKDVSIHLLAVLAGSYMQIHLYADCCFYMMLLHNTHGIKNIKSV